MQSSYTPLPHFPRVDTEQYHCFFVTTKKATSVHYRSLHSGLALGFIRFSTDVFFWSETHVRICCIFPLCFWEKYFIKNRTPKSHWTNNPVTNISDVLIFFERIFKTGNRLELSIGRGCLL